MCGGLKAPVDFIVLCKVYTCMFSAYCIYLYVFCILYTLVCFLHIVYTCMFSEYCIYLYVFCILYILVQCFLQLFACWNNLVCRCGTQIVTLHGRCVRLRSMGALYGHNYLRICTWKHKKSRASTLNGFNTILQ